MKYFILIGLILFSLMLSVNAESPQEFRHYKLNESSGNAIDSSENSSDATESGTVPSQTGKINNSRGAYTTSNYFTVNQGNTFDYSQDISISLWAYTSSIPEGGGDAYDLFLATPSTAGQLHIDLGWQVDGFYFYVYKEGSGGISAKKTLSLSSDTWYWLTATFNSSTNDINIYVDNVAGTGASYSQGSTTAANTFYVGLNAGGFVANDDFYLDDLRFYNAVLTSDERALIYNSGNGTEDSIAPPSTPTFSDFNLFWDQDLTKNVDLNIFSDLNVVFDFNVSFSDLNNDSIILYYNLQHLGDDQNCFGAIRNNRFCGWKEEKIPDINWFLLEEEGTTKHFQSSSEDDHAFKHWSYNLDPEEFEVKESTLILNGSTDWVRALLTFANVEDANTDSNVFFNYSFSANYVGSASRNLTVYDCNSLVLNPDSNENCNSFIISSTKEKDADKYYSILTISNDKNQIVGDKNVNLNIDGNHWVYFNCVNCNPSKYWALDIQDENSDIDRVRNWVSASGPENLVQLNKTVDAHIHYQALDVNHNFNWFVQISTNTGTDYNSLIQTERIESVNLPPLIDNLINPLSNIVYDLNVDVNMAVSDPNYNVIVCDFNLYDSSWSFVKSLGFGVPVTENLCGITDFNSLTVADGNYFIQFIVRETATTELYSIDVNMDLPFIVDNTVPILSNPLPDANLSIYDTTPDLNVSFTEANPFYCTARPFIDGVAQADVNVSISGGKCLYTSASLVVGSTIQVMFFMVDSVNNVSNDLNTEIYTILMMPILADSRYLSEDDARILKNERYFSQEDIRLSDTTNFVKQDDKRQESEVFSSNVLIKSNQNIIIFGLSILFIIGVAWFIWIKK